MAFPFVKSAPLSTDYKQTVDSRRKVCYNEDRSQIERTLIFLKAKTRDLALIALFTAIITVGGFIRIPLPVCPFTLQYTCTMLAGMFLGGKRGAASVALYVILGLLGVPVFTGGGGLSYVLQPTFGYLLGFIVGAFITGAIAYTGDFTFKRLLIGALAGLAAVYVIGMVWFYLSSNLWLGKPLTLWQLFLSCFLLVAPKDLVLCVIAAFLGRRLMPVLHLTDERVCA